jgi:hypothetical protein
LSVDTLGVVLGVEKLKIRSVLNKFDNIDPEAKEPNKLLSGAVDALAIKLIVPTRNNRITIIPLGEMLVNRTFIKPLLSLRTSRNTINAEWEAAFLAIKQTKEQKGLDNANPTGFGTRTAGAIQHRSKDCYLSHVDTGTCP